MHATGYTTSFVVDQTPEEVFDAINNVRGWWSGDIDGLTDRLGAEFSYRYKSLHDTTQKITEWVPGKRVVWHVMDSHINFVKDTTEWNNTDIVFEITRKNGQTELRFPHVGLVPAIECYGGCSDAWGFYINDGLRNLIRTGKGQPNHKEHEHLKHAWRLSVGEVDGEPSIVLLNLRDGTWELEGIVRLDVAADGESSASPIISTVRGF